MDMAFLLSGSSYWLLTFAIALMTAGYMKRFISRPRNLPPGPTGLPFLGVALTIFRSDPLALFSSWADRYGDIVSFNVGPSVLVILNSYHVVKEAFRHPDLQNRHRSQLMKEISGGEGNNGILLSDGERWKEHRNFVHSVFRNLGVGKKSYEEIVAKEMQQLADAIDEKRGTPFDPNILFGQAVANIICSIVFGTQYKYSDKDFKRILELVKKNLELFGAAAWIILFPFPGISKIPFGKVRDIVSNTKELNKFVWKLIESHEATFDPDQQKDLIDQYLYKMQQAKGTDTSFTLRNLEAVIKDLFFAGTDTTTNTLNWCILFMMVHPDIQSRVQDEIDHVIERNRLPKLDDRQNLPYTNAVLMEIQRKAAVLALGVPHVAAADTQVAGFTIPKGATIVSNLYNVFNREDLWENDDFRPERFLTKDGEFVKRDELIFFSSGRRMCLGERLAKMETFLGFTSLLQKFTFGKPNNSPPLSLAGALGSTRNTISYLTCATPRQQIV
ncbi:cytochrome P450 2J4-like [Lytechinus pictus]|uniref:cytochrome P450 2J4-like n=1 Tax=Lytechinus pictus TaxID=7653 RepID=UPI0030BA05EB